MTTENPRLRVLYIRIKEHINIAFKARNATVHIKVLRASSKIDPTNKGLNQLSRLIQ